MDAHTRQSPNYRAGWLGIASGVVSGIAMGLFFHRDDWFGGYASFRRRLLRLGHISFFGLGALNLLYAAAGPSTASSRSRAGRRALVVALATMPATCFLTAWKRPFRHLFVVPVLATLVGVGSALLPEETK